MRHERNEAARLYDMGDDMTAPEGKVRDHLIARCKELGIEARKVRYEGRKGAWDWWLFFPDQWRLGRHAGLAIVELKAEGEPLEHHQIEEGKVYAAAGIVHAKLDSCEAIDEFLK